MKFSKFDLQTIVNIILSLGIILLMSCQNSSSPELLNKGDQAPENVSNIEVKNLGGGAIISYRIPDSRDILYVKAVYSTNNKQRQVKSIYYSDHLTVNGFADTSAHEIRLYTYSRGGTRSKKPVNVTVNPLEPPFQQVFESIEMKATFGGAQLTYSNPDTVDLAITVFKDSSGQISQKKQIFTSAKSGKVITKGAQSKLQKFGYSVRDAFLNRSDTLFRKLKPLREVKLDKTTWQYAGLPFDLDPSDIRHGYPITGLFDNNTVYPHHIATDVTNPFNVTIKMKKKALIDRIVVYSLKSFNLYGANTIRKFELWGTQSPAVGDDIALDDSWFKYGTFLIDKSNASNYTRRVEPHAPYDNAYSGVSFAVPNALGFPKARYVRLHVISSQAGTNGASIGEIDLFGQPNRK